MADGWDRVAELFAAAAALPAAERQRYLEGACGADHELLAEVRSLLQHHDAPMPFLEQPALGATFRVGDAAEVADDPLLGRSIGPYRVEARIGTGGFGAVYRAARHDGLFEQTVAIKLVHPWRCSGPVVGRFRREWQALATVAHPHIARLLDAGVSDDGTPYLVLEHIEGRPIDEHCDLHRLPLPERLRLFETVARAVHFAHQRLVVHCDLKPANIMVTESGLPKLLDFGIARILTPETDAGTVTMTGMMTPDYASPEQLRGEPLSTASDVYSLGVLLYELLVGRRPYRRTTGTAEEIDAARAAADPPRASRAVTGEAGDDAAALRRTTPRRLRRLLAGELDTIVATAMRTDPARRYGSAEQLADDVRRHLTGRPIAARPDSLPYRLKKLLARNPVASATAAAFLLALVGGAAATAWQARAATLEAAHAGIEARSAHRLAAVLADALVTSAPQRSPAQLETVRDLLGRHLEQARRELQDEPHARANFLSELGGVYAHLGLYAEAEPCIEEAAAIRRREFGAESLEVALSHGARGELALRRGDFATAKEQFAAALRLHRELPVGVHTDVATAANNLAVALRQLGDLDGAAALHLEALDLRRRLDGDRAVSVAESLNNLGMIDGARRDFALAEARLDEALSIRRELLGDGHPLVAQTLNNLAIIVHQAGRPQDAEALLRDALARLRATPGVDPESLAQTLANLADSLRMQGDAKAAQAPAAEALDLIRKLHGDRHPQTAQALGVLASIGSELGEHDAAIAGHREALAIAREHYPAGHPSLCFRLCNLGAALLDGDRTAEAEPVFREAITALRGAAPPRPFLLGTALYGLGVVHRRLGRPDEAEPAFREAQEVFASCSAERAEAAAAQLRELAGGR